MHGERVELSCPKCPRRCPIKICRILSPSTAKLPAKAAVLREALGPRGEAERGSGKGVGRKHDDEPQEEQEDRMEGGAETSGPLRRVAPEEQEDAIGVEAEAVAAAAAALVNEATQQSGGPMSTRPSLVMPPQTLIECNEEHPKRDACSSYGQQHVGKPPGFESYRPNISNGRNRQGEPDDNHRHQPTANELEIQRSILAAAKSR
ncbi:hypothetical protein Pmar_PMAR007399, partial [Perkinsus marinus ATCC 50983]